VGKGQVLKSRPSSVQECVGRYATIIPPSPCSADTMSPMHSYNEAGYRQWLGMAGKACALAAHCLLWLQGTALPCPAERERGDSHRAMACSTWLERAVTVTSTFPLHPIARHFAPLRNPELKTAGDASQPRVEDCRGRCLCTSAGTPAACSRRLTVLIRLRRRRSSVPARIARQVAVGFVKVMDRGFVCLGFVCLGFVCLGFVCLVACPALVTRCSWPAMREIAARFSLASRPVEHTRNKHMSASWKS
jgi:hypothetical protein